ncbi:MAG: hypothetical protein M3447_01535 [Acidobacteriota bacterium]|nr:hypothetical protein [Acidobacteriota bacterium]
MAEERTLGLARAYDTDDEELSKEALQARMEEARDSISQTVTEIKDNVTQSYESVKDALDWREHFRQRPVAWSLGAAGVGFCLGYGIAGAVKGQREDEIYFDTGRSTYAEPRSYASEQIGEPLAAARGPRSTEANGHDKGPGIVSRIKETRAFDRLQQEVGTLGDRLVDELSTTAQQVVLPALLRKVKEWIGADLSQEKPKQMAASMRSESDAGYAYEPELERNPS